MKREQYKHIRKTKQIDVGLFYNYYNSKAPDNQIPKEIFFQVFPTYIKMNASVIFSKLDKEFEVNVLMDKQGNEIKIL